MTSRAEEKSYQADFERTLGKPAVAGPGHNRPPLVDFYRETNEALPAYLEEESAALLARYAEIEAAFGRVPAVIDSAELNDKCTDFTNKKISALKQALKGDHSRFKEPFLSGGRVVDAFYKRRDDKLSDFQTEVRKRQTVWNEKVEADKRRAAQEAERVARAAQAEADRIAAEERRKAAEIAASIERAAAEERRKREAAEAEAKRLADEAAAAIKNEQDMAKALILEAAEKRRQAERAEQTRLDEIAAHARQAEADAAAKAAAEEADRRRVDAEQAAKEALAKSTDLTRSRGDQGGVSSLRTAWDSDIEDRAVADLEALREHFTDDAFRDAIKSWVKANAPDPNSDKPCPPLLGAKVWRKKYTR